MDKNLRENLIIELSKTFAEMACKNSVVTNKAEREEAHKIIPLLVADLTFDTIAAVEHRLNTKSIRDDADACEAMLQSVDKIRDAQEWRRLPALLANILTVCQQSQSPNLRVLMLKVAEYWQKPPSEVECSPADLDKLRKVVAEFRDGLLTSLPS